MSTSTSYSCRLPTEKKVTVKLEEGTNEIIPPGVILTGAPELWKQGIRGEGVLVGLIGTGIDSTHQDLTNSVVIARDFVRDAPMKNWNFHATHMAGTIAAHGRLKGIAPDVKLADYRVLDVNGSGSFEAVTTAIYQAVDDGCDILNMSVGGPVDYLPMREAIKYAVSKNVLTVTGVGSEGDSNSENEEISYPAYYNEVVGAGSVGFSQDGKLRNSFFSNSNSQVDVCALGENVISCTHGSKYESISGTATAASHVAGFAALLLSKAKKRNQVDKIPEATLYTMIKTLTLDMGITGIDPISGAGLVSFLTEVPYGDIQKAIQT